MGDNQRHKRLRFLLKQLNKDRKKQAKKIDILCNDLIGAQRGFIRRLKSISFAASFYESIMGLTDLNDLLHTAASLIESDNPGTDAAFFLRQADSFDVYMFETDPPAPLNRERIESCLTPELMDHACKSNRICTLDEIFEMGLHGNSTGLSGASAVTIPLGLHGLSFGFMLVYRSSAGKLTSGEIRDISGIVSGLSRAIACSQARSRAAN